MIIAGLVEGFVHASPHAGLVGLGASAPLIPVIAVAVVTLGRALWRGWRSALAPTTGAEVLAGAAYALVVAIAVFGAGYLAAAAGARTTKLPWLAAMFAGGGAAGMALLALAAARPLVRGIAALVRRVWPGITNRRAGLAIAIVVGLGVLAAWLAARPLLVRYDLKLAAYATGAIAGASVAAIATAHSSRVRRWLGIAVIVVITAAWFGARAARPTVLLEAWNQLPIGGRAIEATQDVHALRARVLEVPAPVARTDQHPDVLLITIDAMRADRLSASVTPNLAALADAVVFDRAYAPSSVTRGSLPTMLTALAPGRIRGRQIAFAIKLDPRHVIVAERFQRAGYQTRGFLCCPQHFGGPYDLGLDRGLDRVVYDPNGAHLAHAAGAFFAEQVSAPRFAWLHVYEPHEWERLYPVDVYDEDRGVRYDRAVTETDRFLGPLIAAVRARPRPTIIVITSDHGEGLGEHGALHHAGTPYASQIHVPLIVIAPGTAPRRVTTPVSLAGLSETLLELAGFAPTSTGDGASLARVIDGTSTGDGEAYSVVLRDRQIPFAAHSLVSGDYHLVEYEGRAPELYNVAADPAELTDLAAREPALLAKLRARLAVHRERGRVPPF